MRKSRHSPIVPGRRGKAAIARRIRMDIRDGWFKGKKAELRTNAAGDWVRIDEDTEFCVKDGKTYLSIDDIGHVDDFRRIYDLLREKA